MAKSFDLGSFAQTLQVSAANDGMQHGPRTIEAITKEIIDRKQTAGESIIQIGNCLIEAKGMLSHGEWSAWLTEQVEFSERSAQRLMRLAREWSNPTALSDLGSSKAFQLLALPPEEREQFLAESHLVNGEEKGVIDMTTRELEKALRERDEAKVAMEQAEASRAKMAADMGVLKGLLESVQQDVNDRDQALAEADAALEALRAQPVDVAVMSVDQEALDKARAEAIAEMQAKVDKAQEAKQKAEEKRRAAEAALESAKASAAADVKEKLDRTEAELREARQQLAEAAKSQKLAAISGDKDIAAFEVIFNQAKETANKLSGLLMKVRSRGDAATAGKLQNALLALSDAIRGCAE